MRDPMPPATLVSGAHTYDLRFVPSVDVAIHPHGVKEGDEEDLFGHVNHKLGVIYVGLDMVGSQQRDTALHEALHTILAQLAHDDEGLVHRLTPALLTFMQENAQFVEFLMQRRFR